MYEIHFNAPIIDGFGIEYPVKRTNMSNMIPANVSARSPNAAAKQRNRAFMTNDRAHESLKLGKARIVAHKNWLAEAPSRKPTMK
jgi:hypothetical protein